MSWFLEIFPSNISSYVFFISSAIMIGATVLLYETLYNQRLRANQETFITIELMSIFTIIMMIGGFLYFLYNTLLVYDISMIIAMVWFIYRAVAGPNPLKGNYLRDARIAFSIIFLTFVMEFFKGEF